MGSQGWIGQVRLRGVGRRREEAQVPGARSIREAALRRASPSAGDEGFGWGFRRLPDRYGPLKGVHSPRSHVRRPPQ